MAASKLQAPASKVLGTPAAPPEKAADHFRAKLAFETDASDLHEDLKNRVPNLIVVDGRSPDSFAVEHIPGAINLHHRLITAEFVAKLPKAATLVTYCAGVYCNASTKAAAKLAALGFHVKELTDGLDGWKKEGYAVEQGSSPQTIRARA